MNNSRCGSLNSILQAVYQHRDPQGHVSQMVQLQDGSSQKKALHLHREHQLAHEGTGCRKRIPELLGGPSSKRAPGSYVGADVPAEKTENLLSSSESNLKSY